MPIIDDISTVPFSAKKGHDIATPNYPILGNGLARNVIELLKEMLAQCKWWVDPPGGGDVAGSATLTAVGLPSGLSGSNSTIGYTSWQIIVTDGITGQNTYYVGYFPPSILIPDAPNGGVDFFVFGATEADSINNLASVLHATYVSGTSGIVSMIVPGKAYSLITGDGNNVVTSGVFLGDGFKYESVGASPYLMEVNASLTFGKRHAVAFNFFADSAHTHPGGGSPDASYVLDADDDNRYFHVVANPYSFAVFNDLGSLGFAVFSPCIATSEGFQGAYAVVVVGPGNLPTKLMWDGYGNPCTVCLDAVPSTFGDVFYGPGVLLLRSLPGGLPLYGLDGQPFSHAAYLSMSQGLGVSNPFVVGKLWDCMVITDSIPLTTPMTIGGRKFICIGTSPGNAGTSRGSLLFCIDDNGQPVAGQAGSGGVTNTGGAGAGGGSSTIDPTAAPGSGTGSPTGTCSATGIPDAFTIKFDTGDLFTADMVGQTITIALPGLTNPWVTAGGGSDALGTLPVIAAVASPTVLTVTAALNSTFDGASFTSP